MSIYNKTTEKIQWYLQFYSNFCPTNGTSICVEVFIASVTVGFQLHCVNTVMAEFGGK